MTSMHILMTVDCVGGVWTYATTLVRALHMLDVRVTLAVLGPAPAAAQVAELDTIDNIVWCHKPGPLEWMPGGPEQVDEAAEWLLSLAERVRPDVVHLNGYAHGAWPFRCPVLVAAHSCVCSWWRAVKGEPAPERLAEYRRVVCRGLAFADMVVAPTQSMLQALVEEHAYAGPRQVIPNGSDLEPEPVAKEPMIFTAARLDDGAKNIELLERAADRLAWPLVVAGGGRERRSDRVAYLGRVDHGTVASWLARAAIYALPARYEPFGLSMLEAARCRCALVAGDIPSLREVWDYSATFVDPNDADRLVSAINALASDERRRGRMASAARCRAERYSADACAAAYFNTYRTLVARSTPRPAHALLVQ